MSALIISFHRSQNDDHQLAGKYGPLPTNKSKERSGKMICYRFCQHLCGIYAGRKRISIATLSPNQEGQIVYFRARVNTSRAQGSKMVFLNLRQRTESVQALVVVTPEKISKQMVKWVASLADESIVVVEGAVQIPKEEVKSATVGNVEILINQVSSHS